MAKEDSADLDLIKACKLWDKITTKANNGEYEMPEELNHYGRNKPYSHGDYSPLQCRITGKVAELTVGSATGHKAKVDLARKVVEYFDNDNDPNETMKQLFEEDARLECDKNYDGVKCTGVTKENVDNVFRILAMPTSMDFRLSNCQREKRPDPTEGCEESCQETLENDYKLPDGCSCSDWVDECTQECVDNYEYDSDEGECIDIEKQFFRDGPKKETLSKQEAIVNPKSQKKMTDFERRVRQEEREGGGLSDWGGK